MAMPNTYAVIGLLAFAAVWLIGSQRNRIAVAHTALAKPVSPADEAERMLARRYARGAISTAEYRRMMAILHG